MQKNGSASTERLYLVAPSQILPLNLVFFPFLLCHPETRDLCHQRWLHSRISNLTVWLKINKRLLSPHLYQNDWWYFCCSYSLYRYCSIQSLILSAINITIVYNMFEVISHFLFLLTRTSQMLSYFTKYIT